MGPIIIGISHDNDLVVVGVVNVKFGSGTGADGIDDRIQLFVFQHVVELRLFGVQHLSTKGQDCLVLPVTALLSRPAGRIPFNQEEFIFVSVLRLGRSELTRQVSFLPALPFSTPGLVAGLPRRLPGFPSFQRLSD